MSHDSLIKHLKSKLLKDTRKIALDLWLKIHGEQLSSDITKASAEYKAGFEQDWLEAHGTKINKKSRRGTKGGDEPEDQDSESIIVQEQYRVKKEDYEKMQVDLGKKIDEDYGPAAKKPLEDQFLDLYWNAKPTGLEQLFSKQIDSFNPQAMLSRFLIDHPWLEEDILKAEECEEFWKEDPQRQDKYAKSMFRRCIAFTFLETTLSEALLQLKNLEQNEWTWENLQAVKEGTAGWAPIDPEILALHTKEYPLSEVEKLFYNNICELSSIEDAWRNQEIYDYSLKRVDVLRYLATNHKDHIKLQKVDELHHLPLIAPFIASELLECTPNPFEFMQTILVNISEEEAPSWMCLTKNGASWDLYRPKELDPKKQEELDSLVVNLQEQCNIVINIIPIDVTEQEAQNDLGDFKPIPVWHAVLFGRILPWIKNQKDEDRPELSNFRSKVPLPLLFEYTLGSCHTYYDQFVSAWSDRFAKRTPLSNKKLDDTYINTKHKSLNKDTFLLSKPDFYSNKSRITDILQAFDEQSIELLASDQEAIPDTLSLSADATIKDLSLALFVIYHAPNLTQCILPPIPLDKTIKELEQSLIEIEKELKKEKKLKKEKELEKEKELVQNLTELINYNTSLFKAQPLAPETIKGQNSALALTMSCAARNRLLFSTLSEPEWDALSDVLKRSTLWQEAAAVMTRFYKEQTPDLDFMEAYQTQNEDWSKSYFDMEHEPEDQPLLSIWQFAQFAQTGRAGLDALFQYIQDTTVSRWDATLQEPAPNLSAVFDLSGSLTDTPKNYTQYLKDKIKDLCTNGEPRAQSCSPVFKSLSFIAPMDLASVEEELLELFRIIHEHKTAKVEGSNLSRYNHAVSEISLYNLGKQDSDSLDSFLNHLEQMAKDGANPLQIIIRIPEWDRTAPLTEKARQQKARYKEIQNLILENQRQDKLQALTEHTKDLHLSREEMKAQVAKKKKEEKIKTVTITNHKELWKQSWEGIDDINYPLPAQKQTLGIQQQQQQQQEYQAQQAQEEEVEQEYEQQNLIGEYRGDEGLLITRDTIDAIKGEDWALIPDAVKRFSGWNNNALKQLFSLWVGSEVDAAGVIRKMEPSAVQKLMECAPEFRLGISQNNLPAGFSLDYSRKDKSLVLSFSKEKEKQDLLYRKQQNPKERNRFKVAFYKPLAPQIFRGDFRQFSALSQSVAHQKLLHKFLATEDTDAKRLEQARELLHSLKQEASEENVSTQAQEHTAFNQFTASAGDWHQCLSVLKTWAAEHIANKDLLDALFDPEEKDTVLTPENLLALGQLFYNHEVKVKSAPEIKNASDTFLTLASQILETFGPDHFSTWKKYILDPSANYTELLTKEEVEQVVSSIATLDTQDNQDLQDIWWALIEAHGKSTGFTRYGPLWESFHTLLIYAEKNKLVIDAELWLPYLESAKNFNAQVFLDRLYSVLKNSKNEPQAHIIQQDILDNINEIDWCHSGFYYASRFEKFPFWDSALKLSGFQFSNQPGGLSYLNRLDSLNKPQFSTQQRLVMGLRFLSQKARLPFEDFHRCHEVILSQFIDNKFIEEPRGLALYRLFLACLSQGSDTIEELTEEVIKAQIDAIAPEDEALISWIASKIALDRDLKSGSLNLKFEQIVPLVQAIREAKLEEKVLGMRDDEALAFINSCGRALNCYSSPYVQGKWPEHNIPAEQTLSDLLCFINNAGLQFNDTLLTGLPWLYLDLAGVEDPIWQNPLAPLQYTRETAPFLQHLSSIDFAHSQYLPEWDELKQICKSMQDETYEYGYYAPAESRKQFIQGLIQKGCQIKHQDANFRPLTPSEKTAALEYTNKYLKVYFKTHNQNLFNILLNDCLAIEALGINPQKKIEALLKTLISMDTKAYSNDLGQVLGLLIDYSKRTKQKHYSLEQLTAWLSLLIDPETIGTAHFPIPILKIILEFQLSKEEEGDATLLNGNLNALNPALSHLLHTQISKVLRSTRVSSQNQAVLVHYILNHEFDVNFSDEARTHIEALHEQKANPTWLKAIGQFIKLVGSLSEESFIYQSRKNLLNRITINAATAQIDESLAELWGKTQIKLVALYQQENLTPESISVFDLGAQVNAKASYIQMILLETLTTQEFSTATAVLGEVKEKLMEQDIDYLKQLASYCSKEPKPSLAQLNTLLRRQFKSAELLIHHFETVVQAEKPDPDNPHQTLSKREYSITPKENEELFRVLDGFRQKGKGPIPEAKKKKLLELLFYTNNYSQLYELEDLSSKDLKEKLEIHRKALQELKRKPDSLEEQFLTSARLLACMREIFLRQTGKWVNHTQMLDLLYSVMHSDESLLHQVRTGQGKSLISLMRVAYLALDGQVVDFFSSKDSLSKRDHEEFGHVLDAMGIPNAYITPHSPAEAYKDGIPASNMGSVNFFTIGNLSLYSSAQIWNRTRSLKINPQKRVAFIDECDFILKFENTQFNYSANINGGESVFNFDAWAYRIAYLYYQQHLEDFEEDGNGIKRIHNTNLEELCEVLQAHAHEAPPQSTFLKKFIAPAATRDPAAEKRRDNELKRFLIAANNAHNLVKDRDYSIRFEQQVYGGTVFDTQFAKVLIGNQIKDGATYSELVHQFLHVALNEQQVEQGKSPNFPIKEDTIIALSSNMPYILKNNYGKIEGCSATPGNLKDLQEFAEVFGIHHVVKLPPHEPLKIDYQGVEYHDDQASQVKAIVDALIKQDVYPILQTCEDDIEVKELFTLIKEEIERRIADGRLDRFDFEIRLYEDTNDKGREENDILPSVGKDGRVTASSKMGRGTDIKPDNKVLMVLRTYPALPEIVKQEGGRGGRNGTKGIVLEIINYGPVLKQYKHWTGENSPYKERLDAIFAYESQHLEEKLNKHEEQKSEKWKWLTDSPDMDTLKEKYLITRSVQQLKYEIKKENEKYLRQKEALIASLCGNIVSVLQDHFDDNPFPWQEFKEQWLACKTEIELLWDVRLAGKIQDDDAVYAAFHEQAQQVWNRFCLLYKGLDKNACQQRMGDPMPEVDPLEKPELYLKNQIKHLEWHNKGWSVLSEADLQNSQEQVHAILERFHPENLDALEASAKEKQQMHYKGISEQGDKLLALISQATLTPSRAEEANSETREDLKAAISFYQKWLEGAQERHFTKGNRLKKDLLDVLYGTVEKAGLYVGLDRFYESLYQVSSQNLSGEPLENRTLLFDAFAEQVPEGLYFIPVLSIAKVVGHLSTKLGDAGFKKHLACLEDFFSQELFQNIDLHEASAEDLRKYGRLFELSVSIASCQTDKSDTELEDTKACITNLCHQIHEHFWDQLDDPLVTDLQTLFASSSEVTDLLTQKKLQLDLYHFVNLINQNKGVREPVHQQRLDQLLNFLKAEPGDIKIGSIRALFQIVLGETDISGDKELYLPELEKLSNLDGSIWTFIAQRQPVSKKELVDLLEVLHIDAFEKVAEEENEFLETVFEPLLALPPYVSLGYISEHLRGKLSLSNQDDTQRAFADIKASTEAFNAFALQKGLIASDTSFSHDQAQLYQNYVRLFNGLRPEQSRVFFNQCAKEKYAGVSLEWVLAIGDDLLSKRMPNERGLVKRLLELGSMASDLNTTHQVNLLQHFKDSSKDQALIKRYREFFEAIRGKNINAPTMQQLAQAWVSNRISSPSLLQESIATIDVAQDLQNKQRNWYDYFWSFNKNGKTRQHLMQLVHHGILELGQVFKETCYKAYESMVKRERIVYQLPSDVSLEERRSILTTNYRKIVALSEELQAIHSGIEPSGPNMLSSKEKDKYFGFFAEQEKAYQSLWFKCSDRKKQALELFQGTVNPSVQGLMKIDASTDAATFFKTALNTIWKSQKNIMESDKDTYRNSKGYSRLYDVTVQMTIYLAKEFIKDPGISIQDKAWLQERMTEQKIHHLSLLAERLPENHCYKKLFSRDWPEDTHSMEYKEFEIAMKRVSIEALPKHLRYLMTNIACFIDISEDGFEREVIEQQVTDYACA